MALYSKSVWTFYLESTKWKMVMIKNYMLSEKQICYNQVHSILKDDGVARHSEEI